jgi:divalent metal cation (Fe/Co/Zn/Cd) transporter
MSQTHDAQEARIYQRTIILIAALVLSIGVSETLYGLTLDSRFLVRDGLEWTYDVVIYATAAAAFGRGLRAERFAAFVLALVLLGAGLVTIWQIWRTVVEPPEVEPFGITLAGLLIIAEAWTLVALLWRFRRSRHPVIEATWLSSRNDAVTSTLYALVMMAARFTPMTWPQMAVDSISAILCLQAGGQVLRDLLRVDKGGKA